MAELEKKFSLYNSDGTESLVVKGSENGIEEINNCSIVDIKTRKDIQTINTQLKDIAKQLNPTESIVEVEAIKTFEKHKLYANATYKLGAYANDNNITSKTFKVNPGEEYYISGISGNDEQCLFYAVFSSLIEDVSANAKYINYLFIAGESTYNVVKDYKIIIPEGANYLVVNGHKNSPVKCCKKYTSQRFSDEKNGILVSDDLQTITHFTKNKNNYICRVFKHCFINNLLQLESMYLGNFVDGNLVKISDIGTSSSDVIGPISINRGEQDNYSGNWSGGTHPKTIDNVDYPTAKEISLKIYCNNEEIIKDGYYYGNSKIITVNDLYFPQTITGSNMDSATKAIKETRTYSLNNKMEVDVKMEFYTNVIVTMYYGCQCNTYNMTDVIFPNNEIKSKIKGLSKNVDWLSKENKYFCYNSNNMHYDIELKPYGLGTWKYNTSTQFGYLATFSKIYFILMQNQSEVTKRFDESKVISWGAIYDFYID